MKTKLQKCNDVSNSKAIPKGWPLLGLSSTSYLNARIFLKRRQNAEGQLFTSVLENPKECVKRCLVCSDKFESKSSRAKYCSDSCKAEAASQRRKQGKVKKRGNRVNQGLSRKGKTSIRIVADCYNLLVNDPDFYNRYELEPDRFNAFNRFITLTFRNIIPSDQEAKKLLNTFFQRLRRLKKSSLHYVWVAERQKRGAIHFHILTPEKISEDENSKRRFVKEANWINNAWNEIVADWALKAKKINVDQYATWLNENKRAVSYFKRLSEYKLGSGGNKPRKPSGTTFNLLPNLVYVHKVGNYMAKYMSKEGQNIIGGMYDISQESRQFLKAVEQINARTGSTYAGNKIIQYAHMRAKQEGQKVFTWELEFNGTTGIWCPDYTKLLQYYFEYLEYIKIKNQENHPKNQ